MKKLSVVDLFAGCGGLSLGLEQAGFQSVYVNELNKDAMESYLMNRDLENPYLRERFNSNDVKSMILDKKYISSLSKDLKNTYNLDVKNGDLDYCKYIKKALFSITWNSFLLVPVYQI